MSPGPPPAHRTRGGVGTARLRLAALAVLVAGGTAANAQDSLQVAPPDSVRTERPLLAPSAPASGRPLTPVPALTPALDAADLLARPSSAALSSFAYELGAPGHLAGLSLDALAPERSAVTLDGRPLDDLFTGAPRVDLLPWEATDRIALAGPEAGAPLTLATTLRPFRERVPITELRFHSGRLGIQNVAGTHAQTHRSPWGIGGERARLTGTFHVGSRRANGPTSGATLRQTNVLARLALAAPGWAAEVTNLYADRRSGARRGVRDDGFAFDPFRASVLDPGATRTTLRNELAATLRAPAVSRQPLAVWSSWTRQVSRYSPASTDTVSAAGNRFAAGLSQRLGRPTFRAWAALDDDPWGRLDPLGDGNERLQIHAALTDTLALGTVRLAGQVGGHLADGQIGPALALRAEAGAVSGAVSWTGVIPGRIEESGYFPPEAVAPGVPVGLAADGREQVIAAEIGGRAKAGAFRLTLRPFGRLTVDAHRLLEREDVETATATDLVFGYGRAIKPVGVVGAQAALGWREATDSGLYLRSTATAQTWPLRDPTEVSGRMAEAAPAVFGTSRLGLRATRVGTGTASLDAGATVRAWTAYRGLRVHPATGLLALARTDADRLPARATLDLDAEVTFGTRARVSIAWIHVLSGLAYDGVRTLQGEPMPGRHLRFGVFWAFTE